MSGGQRPLTARTSPDCSGNKGNLEQCGSSGVLRDYMIVGNEIACTGSEWSAIVGCSGLFFCNSVLQTKSDPISLAVGGIRLDSVRALRSIMGETARHSSDR